MHFNLVIAAKSVWDIVLKTVQKHNSLLIPVNTGMITEKTYNFLTSAHEDAGLGYALR